MAAVNLKINSLSPLCLLSHKYKLKNTGKCLGVNLDNDKRYISIPKDSMVNIDILIECYLSAGYSWSHKKHLIYYKKYIDINDTTYDRLFNEHTLLNIVDVAHLMGEELFSIALGLLKL